MGRVTQTKPRLGNGKDWWQTPCTMTIRWAALIIALSGSSYALLSVAATELELEVKAGIPPVRALQIATFNAAKLLKQDKELGSIASGKRADLLLVEGNPSETISDIRRCGLVMKNGILYKSNDIYASVGIKPAE